ncbi:Suppressor of RPS4-RLD 1 [Camellia lanceoleosa]|uniref:Suppressor of RPS4-RLD 1 n=1 Tax=Camellia lanceoleosa TaxID=1840588 RepID=A0ACC0J1P3_9ERIC|nr:Suppressor of RPS4-RLD 1 [Camellia lanceoleosa]
MADYSRSCEEYIATQEQEVASSGKKYGGLVPKKKPLISKIGPYASYADFDAAIEDLSACVKLDKDNKSAYTYLGLALSSIGEYRRAEEAHMKSIQLDPSFLESWAHLT